MPNPSPASLSLGTLSRKRGGKTAVLFNQNSKDTKATLRRANPARDPCA